MGFFYLTISIHFHALYLPRSQYVGQEHRILQIQHSSIDVLELHLWSIFVCSAYEYIWCRIHYNRMKTTIISTTASNPWFLLIILIYQLFRYKLASSVPWTNKLCVNRIKLKNWITEYRENFAYLPWQSKDLRGRNAIECVLYVRCLFVKVDTMLAFLDGCVHLTQVCQFEFNLWFLYEDFCPILFLLIE